MKSSIIWKLILSVVIVGWAVLNLLPMEDKDFDEFILTRATANQADYQAFLERAEERVNDTTPLFLAIKEQAKAEKVDLYHKFYPDVDLVLVKNQDKRNDVIMNVLYEESRGKLRKGLDLAGGVAFTLKLKDQPENDQVASAQLKEAVRIMESRVNGLGVAEPIIRPVGNNQIEVQLPGLDLEKNPEAADALKKPAHLEFRLVHRDIVPGPGVQAPLGFEEMVIEDTDREGNPIEEHYFVKIIPEATGEIVDRAFPIQGQYGGYEILLNMTSDGGDVFADMTRKIAAEDKARNALGSGKMAIVLDGKLYSALGLNNGQPITGGSARITGTFTQLEAQELANVLNNPLKFELEVGEKYVVSPTLAADARDSSIEAALLGAGAVVVFMILYYLLAGIVSVASVGLSVIVVLGVLMSVGGTLTLPGVAALVLTIGMAVDANILIFERMREELSAGKNMKNALAGGYAKAFSTIIDANITTLLTAAILIWLGAGPVKGFGVTLAIGIGASMFGALVVSRFMLEILVSLNLLKSVSPFSLLEKAKFTFLAYRRPAFICSWLIVLAGVVVIWTHREHILGIDFRGGVEVTMDFEQASKPGLTEIEQLADANPDLGEIQPGYLSMLGSDKERLKLQVDLEEGRVDQVVAAMQKAFPDAQLVKVSESAVGATVSDEITFNAILSILVSLAGILLYVALRFELGYGVGAVVSTVHDVLMSIGIFVIVGQFFGIGSGQFTAPMVAAILMIVGYSINDTIVVFDRIREELDLRPDMTLFDVCNYAINRTLSRTLLTSVTTLLAALALYIFGAGVVTDFALIFIIGIITGTFSSIFIASPVFYWWHKGNRKHVTERHLTRPTYEWETTTRRARDAESEAKS
ncbi:protein translocase subunit SecD [Ruficoccus amylovorans]|uniref:Multifunctional fusion protein n=1 Tax=Ruficoccus amylovorans TaxID=1804625 RepID=A0A842HKW4_9BACT|nr:protein translocase subunit SecD [Ruficoccus amylovorans]MBC2596107.1 protein translocase subunit SecD [Ruficoccus amylovorans]